MLSKVCLGAEVAGVISTQFKLFSGGASVEPLGGEKGDHTVPLQQCFYLFPLYMLFYLFVDLRVNQNKNPF